jgi:hypothetical protein
MNTKKSIKILLAITGIFLSVSLQAQVPCSDYYDNDSTIVGFGAASEDEIDVQRYGTVYVAYKRAIDAITSKMPASYSIVTDMQPEKA